MIILGILSNFDSVRLESWTALKSITSDSDVLILADRDPIMTNKSENTFQGFFGYFFENKHLDQSEINLDTLEGDFIKVSIDKDGGLNVTTDEGCRADLYYVNNEKLMAFSTRLELLLELFEFFEVDVEIDQLSLAHSLSIYGNRSPKKSTPYLQIKRLGYRECLNFKKSILSVSTMAPDLPRTDNSIQKNVFLENYSETFLSALDKRTSLGQNIVFFSSGWDSSAIVAGLNKLVGKDKITCIIGEMKYSERAGVINNFEIDRAKRICDFYGIELKVIPLNYANSLPTNFEDITEFLKFNHLASLTSVNHFLLTEAVRNFSDDDCRIFAGEISDGAHNLGFSQFVSIFHPNSLEFREYGDKMMSYLFGPSFLEAANEENLELDPVWTYFRNRSEIFYEKPCDQIEDRINQFLKSFFLRNNRLPFSAGKNLKLLTPLGINNYENKFIDEYFTPLSSYFSIPYLYSLYIHLYNSFHWQGSTVNSIEIAGDLFNLKSTNPFHDHKLLRLLQSMPENFGRGLDLNPTKYPLKWTLENRLNYPMELNSGYHSYTYDINPQFNHAEEILFHSSFQTLFSRILKQGHLLERLDANIFETKYIDDLSSRYVNSRQVYRNEFSDLLSICTHSLII